MIELNNVEKHYGNTVAIKEITLNLTEKKIYCLLGKNGAGKTTLMNLISGKIPVTSGEIAVNRERVTTLKMPESVRYIETAKTQFNMRVSKLLKLASELDNEFDIEFANRMLAKFKLDGNKKYNALSFGMKTMVSTVLVLASNDDIVMLDEPVLGFDAVMRKEFYELLSESFAEHPRIIIVSTHLIDEIADVAKQVIMINDGELIFNEDINTVVEKAYKVSGLPEQVKAYSKDLNLLSSETVGKYEVAYIFDKRKDEDFDVDIEPLSLQELFIKWVEG